jgi:hypothetical protein
MSIIVQFSRGSKLLTPVKRVDIVISPFPCLTTTLLSDFLERHATR